MPVSGTSNLAVVAVDNNTLAILEQRLGAAEENAHTARAEACSARRQMRVTWAVACLACLSAFELGANPNARAQFGVTLTSLDARLKIVETKTASMSALTDPNTSKPTVRFSGVNVQIVSGSGATSDNASGTSTPLGLGNLIVGYNEPRGGSADNRTGSHNLIVGQQNNYLAYGGIVAGISNAIGGRDTNNNLTGIYACVTGGVANTASGDFSIVLGGEQNTASGIWSGVLGGLLNAASNNHASVSGGLGNQASGFGATVSGGESNTASGGSRVNNFETVGGSVSGGWTNTASGIASSVSGGIGNIASGQYSSDSGGRNRAVGGMYQWAAGSESGNGFFSGNYSSP